MAIHNGKMYTNQKKAKTVSENPEMDRLRDIYSFLRNSNVDMDNVFLAFLDPTNYVGIQLAVKKIKKILNEQQTLRNLH